MRIGNAIAEPLDIAGTHSRKERNDRVAELLELVGLPKNSVERYPHEFSGGQRQRIVIARALALNPDFVVCDEPVSALDVSMQAQIVNLLLDLQDRLGLSYLFIAHDLAVVRAVSTRVAVMYAGAIVETAPKAQIYSIPSIPIRARCSTLCRAPTRILSAIQSWPAKCQACSIRRPAAVFTRAARSRWIGAGLKCRC